MKIEVLTDGFALRKGWRRRTVVKWSAVTAIHAQRVNRITYDELFLVFEQADGKPVSVGELDKGFAAFCEALRILFPSIEANWYALAETQAGKAVEIWRG